MKIFVSNKQKDLKFNSQAVKGLVREILAFLKVSCEEVGIYFVSENKICQLHEQFFQDPTPTDCITFPIDSSYLGDIFVCPAVALQYAQKRKRDPHEETALYIVHGLLHLIGHDDLEEKPRRAMRKMEKSCMRHLKKLKYSIR